MGANKSQSNFGGGGRSRFAHLEDINEDEVEAMEAVTMDENDSREKNNSARNESGSSAVNAKGKKSMDSQGPQGEEVIVVLSHPSIVEGMRSTNGVDMDSTRGAVTVNQRLMKEKALKHITNKLKSRPVKMKPNWGGLKNRSRVIIIEARPTNKWFMHSAESNMNASGPNGTNISNVRGGPLPSWPPDPIRDQSSNKAPSETFIQLSNGIRAQKRLEEDEV